MQSGDEVARLIYGTEIPCQGGWVAGGLVKCGRPATHIVRVHMLDKCNVPGLDKDGNRLFFCCSSCAAKTGFRVGELIQEMHDARNAHDLHCADCNGEVRIDYCMKCGRTYRVGIVCKLCQRPIMSLHDMLDMERI